MGKYGKELDEYQKVEVSVTRVWGGLAHRDVATLDFCKGNEYCKLGKAEEAKEMSVSVLKKVLVRHRFPYSWSC